MKGAQWKLEQANAQITSLQSALEAANAQICALQQPQSLYSAYPENHVPPSRGIEESKDHTPQNKEKWLPYLQRNASGFFTGFLGLRESSRAPQHLSRSVIVPPLSSSDEEDQPSTEDASLTSCGPAPPSLSWGEWIVSWLQAACQTLARGFRICFCKGA